MNAPVDVTGVRIETERLVLRPWRESDLHDLYEYAKVYGVGQMAGWMPHKELKENGKVIGSLGLEEMDTDPVDGEQYGRELGYVLSKDYWGRGLMPEAVQAVIGHCFDVLKLDYVTCGHFHRNDRSRRVIEKTGFVFFGESRHKTRYETVECSRNYVLFNPRKDR